MASCTLCEHWSAHAAVDIGLVNKIVPVLKAPDGRFIGNPMVSLERFDAWGNPAYGAFKSGTEREAAKAAMAGCTTDLSLLDAEVEAMAYKLSLTMPDCLAKTLESVRKKKLEHWQRTGEVLPDSVLEELKASQAIVLGAVGAAPGSKAIPSGLLERGLEHPELDDLKLWFDAYCPRDQRRLALPGQPA